jgi:hypothetical protein
MGLAGLHFALCFNDSTDWTCSSVAIFGFPLISIDFFLLS